MEAGVFEDQVVSMVDVLDEDNELEEEARAVLGDSDDKNCTYLAGYVKRQALYACSTCSPADNEPAGICLACTLACHDGHVLYELYTKSQFKMWKQRCELLFTGPMAKIDEEIKCKHLLYWSGEQGIELFNSWHLSADEQKKLDNYWERFEHFLKPHLNELIAAWELYNLRQGTLSLEEFIAKLRILVKEANYPAEHNDRFLRDVLVLGMKSDHICKDCFKVGNALTFNTAREMAKSEESAEKQLQLMNTEVRSINAPKGYQGLKNQPQNTSSGKSQACRNCGWGPHSRDQCPAKNATCHYCHKVGHLAKVCLSKLKKKDVHDIEATSNGAKKALLEVSLSLSPAGKQTPVLCKIDSGAETNIIPTSLYNQLAPRVMNLQKPTAKLTAYGGTEIPNLGSCQVYVKGPNNPKPKVIQAEVVDVDGPPIIVIQAEVVDVDGPPIIGNISAQSLNLLKLNWAVAVEVSGTSHFSILDARSRFWQVELDDESSKLCTFSTPWGKYRWKRLPFGLTCSGDVFQEKMDNVFGNLDGLSGIADDTFVYGKSEAEHNQHILNVLDTARENNIQFNPDKFQFKVDQTSFFGCTWTPDGLRADDLKIKAIRDMPSPQNLAKLQMFMGMVNYLNRFSPIMTQTSEPLRQLMKKGIPFVWQPEHHKAFQSLKQIITEAPVLAYYNPEKDNVIQSDASLKGLGCVLIQDGKPVCYASRSLSDTEARYSNIERELLAACWSLERLSHYVFGKKVVVETDHKPLESIWKKSIPSASPCLHRLLLKMSKYNVEIKYIQGKTNVVADALSRVCCMESPDEDSETPLLEVDAISHTLPASPAKLDEIRHHTSQDNVLSHLKDVIHQGWPEYPNECPASLKEFWNFREDLSVENGLILKGHRLLIPRPSGDYYSKYPIVRKLSSTTSSAVINHLKSIFAENGVPETLISDNGPQYNSQEFAEWSVQTVKNLLRKAEAPGQDPYLALLTYWTMPVDSNLPSPSHLLNRRAYCTQLPCSGHLQRSQAFDSHREQLQNRQDTQRNKYDRQGTHTLRRLNQGEQVVVFQPQTKEWIPAEVKEETSKPRSYIVKTTSGSELRGNRVQLKPLPFQKTPTTCGEQVISNQESTLPDSHETKPLPLQTSSSELPKAPAKSTLPSNQGSNKLPRTTRSGRIVKEPSKLDL
ncbi:Retrovirus-related Pol polyprotein from transposon 17.6 [Stylophora pistillata]|uniref:Retrovirus-related Pol polyprotein from transposon 17.6 n=1 Tax=Stylophora pistillata TaxID=50429 RepID=A0A2B4RNI0_STYPI|nr:Retrovirus-related Pol polyprotein from transposon 17.6 [Stylophora pistillata]